MRNQCENGLYSFPFLRFSGSIKVDSLAQQVEHLPFKEGVLGSSPRRVTISKVLVPNRRVGDYA